MTFREALQMVLGALYGVAWLWVWVTALWAILG